MACSRGNFTFFTFTLPNFKTLNLAILVWIFCQFALHCCMTCTICIWFYACKSCVIYSWHYWWLLDNGSVRYF
jgi:hypothetical protein